MNKHVVIFKGNGIWKDQKGVLWGNNNSNKDIQGSRTFTSDQTKDEFLSERSDIGFMVQYGQMVCESTSENAETPASTETPKDVKPVETPAPVETLKDVKPAPVETPKDAKAGTITITPQQK